MSANKSRRKIVWLIIVLAVTALVYNAFRTNVAYEDLPITYAFQGNSDDLKNTHIVPTLDTTSSADKNIVWCGSFALAWRQLKDQVIKEPIQLANAKPIADRLNNCPFGPSDLTDDCWFAAAGRVKDGIEDKIIQGMNRKFPDVKPDLQVDPLNEIIAYAYLQAAVVFEIPFLPYGHDFTFHDSNGNQTQVNAFGICGDDSQKRKIKKQVEILYQTGFDPRIPEETEKEFVLDMSKNTKPYQIILATVPFKGTLGETVSYVNDKIKNDPPEELLSKLFPNDIVKVPDMAWSITHHFRELEGADKHLINKGFEGLFMGKAVQQIDFVLNNKGAILKSQARTSVEACYPRQFIFDHPFLLLMRKRGSDQPILALWIADTELLVKQSP